MIKNVKSISISVLVAILGLWLIWLWLNWPVIESKPADWTIYINNELGLSLSHPADWVVVENLTDEVFPRINFYPETASPEPPVIHHSQVANVSIFPAGVPTDGVIGQTRPSEIEAGITVAEGQDYILQDETVWASLIRPAHPPAGWTEFGFIWARAEIKDLELSCRRAGAVRLLDQCEPMAGDQLIRAGRIDSRQRQIQEQILESIEFLNS